MDTNLQRRRERTAWFVFNCNLMLNRYLVQPDAGTLAALLSILNDYKRSLESGGVERPLLPI